LIYESQLGVQLSDRYSGKQTVKQFFRIADKGLILSVGMTAGSTCFGQIRLVDFCQFFFSLPQQSSQYGL